MYGLLDGLRVVEGAAFIAGPSCGLYLAQMGAEVIRFDTIGGGPDFRRWPLAPASQDSLYWEGLNKGKKSIAIDLTRPEGRELAIQIATAPGPEAGLFLTNYPIGSFLSHAALGARRADMISVRVMGWNDGSPAVDYTINAAVGVPMMTGQADSDQPVNHMLPAWDLVTGAYCAFALMAALLRRRTTGEGAELRVALSDVAATSLGHLGNVAEVLAAGADRPKMGNDLFGAFGRDFLCRGGARVMVVAITPRQWKGLLAALDIAGPVTALEQELAVDFVRDESARFIHRERLFPIFEHGFALRSAEEIGPLLESSGATWGRYQGLHEAVTGDARLFLRNPQFEKLTHPSGLTYPAPGPAAVLANAPRRPLVPAPRLGEHTDEVLAMVLRLDSGAIGKLHDEGLVA
jgi:2-methylfumaryl-CoA isomerase